LQRVSHSQVTKRNQINDNFDQYYREVGRTKMLDAKTERNLVLKYRRKKRDGTVYWVNSEARDRIIQGCLRFVVTLACRYTADNQLLEDLVAAGNEGLLFALTRYDPNRNIRFLSYATHYVLLYIRNELHRVGLVAMPLWRQKTIRKMLRVRSEYATATGNKLPEEAICEKVDISLAQLDRLHIEKFHYVPFDTANLSANGNEGRAINKQAKELLERLMFSLGSKERFVLRSYFGLISDTMSLRQIANVLGVSSERVRQIKSDALETLRKDLSRGFDVHATKELFHC